MKSTMEPRTDPGEKESMNKGNLFAETTEVPAVAIIDGRQL